jgi:hypothetical protein
MPVEKDLAFKGGFDSLSIGELCQNQTLFIAVLLQKLQR